jgi:hypothetical protein
MTEIAGSASGSVSISQRHESADPDLDPDPHRNVMDPQHWIILSVLQLKFTAISPLEQARRAS